jgi:phage shock protein B
MMEDVFLPIAIVGMLFIGMPWLFLHYRMKFKQNRSLSIEDEQLLDELHRAAMRLEDRIQTIERIMSADNPGWRQIAADDGRDPRLETRREESSASNVRRMS